MALDDLGAPFWFGLGSFAAGRRRAVGERAAAGLSGARIRVAEPHDEHPAGSGQGPGWRRGAAPAWLRVGFLETPAHTGGGHLALARGAFTTAVAGHGGLAAAAFTTRGTPARTPAMGATLMWRPADSPLGVQAGWMGEPQALLGRRRARRIRDSRRGHRLRGRGGPQGRGPVAARRQRGVRRGPPGDARRGHCRGVSRFPPARSRSTRARRRRTGARCGSPCPQPLRVERGRARLIVPAARTKAGAGAAPVGAGRSGAQRPADRRRRAMEPGAGKGRASPGRGVELPAGPRQGGGAGGDAAGGMAVGVLRRACSAAAPRPWTPDQARGDVVGSGVTLHPSPRTPGQARGKLDPGSRSRRVCQPKAKNVPFEQSQDVPLWIGGCGVGWGTGAGWCSNGVRGGLWTTLRPHLQPLVAHRLHAPARMAAGTVKTRQQG